MLDDETLPATIVYDYACNLSQYIFNRSPRLAMQLMLFHDR